MSSHQWLCGQIGAREHYAVPRALHQQGMLAGLVTDWYAFGDGKEREAGSQKSEVRSQTSDLRPLNSVSRRLSSLIRHSSARATRCEDIPDSLVRAFPFRSVLWKWRVRRLAAQKRSHEAYLQTDSAFATAMARLKLPPHDIFFGYAYASLEMLEAEKKRGVFTVLDQIDPSAVEFQLVTEEMARFPNLAGPPPEFPAAYYERNRCEWEMADIIIVNSGWSRDAIVAQGADAAKIEILPLAYEMDTVPSSIIHHPSSSSGTLRVLWLGQVNVRKGIHYLMEAARKLESENMQFDIVGPIAISPDAVASAPGNVTFHGRIGREQAADWYRRSHLFVLPTLSDGFAITQLEAMSHGLPVITTPCCGEVVSNGVDGFVVPPRDPDALVRVLQRYRSEPDLLKVQQQAASVKARQFTLERLAENLRRLETTFVG